MARKFNSMDILVVDFGATGSIEADFLMVFLSTE